jgi:hypothetical protein
MTEALPRIAEIAHSYRSSIQGICYQVKKHGHDVVADPERLFAALVETSTACKLRSWLSNPKNRKLATLKLSLFTQIAELRTLKLEARQLWEELETRIATLNAQARQ